MLGDGIVLTILSFLIPTKGLYMTGSQPTIPQCAVKHVRPATSTFTHFFCINPNKLLLGTLLILAALTSAVPRSLSFLKPDVPDSGSICYGQPNSSEPVNQYCGQGLRDCPAGYFCLRQTVQTTVGVCCRQPIACPPNAEYITCLPPCQPTCTEPRPHRCTLSTCVPGCRCRTGFVKDPQTNQCVELENCPLHCPINEEYKECGSACPPTCRKPIVEGGNGSLLCTKDCVKGCFCKASMVRSSTGKCIPASSCPNEGISKCRNGAPELENSFCGSGGDGCPPTHHCLVKNGPDGWAVCCPDEPLCPGGMFYLKGATCGPRSLQSCPSDHFCLNVLERCCPKAYCGTNQEYQECGPGCPVTCERAIDNKLSHLGPSYQEPVCNDSCVSDCFCQPGFVLGPMGNCMLITDCPEACDSSTEQYSACGPVCEPTCNKSCSHNHTAVQQRNVLSDERATTINSSNSCGPAGCYCKPGYVRGKNGDCVLPKSCRDCGSHQVHKNCGQMCTCGGRSQGGCHLVCANAGMCFCDDGFYMVENGTNCVHEEDC